MESLWIRRATWGLALALPACGYLDRHVFDKGSSSKGAKDVLRIVDPDLEAKLDELRALSLKAVKLRRASSCEDAAGTVRTVMLAKLKSNYDAQMQSWAQRKAAGVPENAPPMQAEPASGAVGGDLKSGPAQHTTTNNQIEGVEEGDFIKNTGTHMFVARHDRIFVVKSWPASQLAEMASLVIGDRIQEMLLVDNKTLVIAGQPQMLVTPSQPPVRPRNQVPGQRSGDSAMEDYPDTPVSSPTYPSYSVDTTALTLVDVSSPQAPRVVMRRHLQGGFRSFRRVGQSVRLILQGYLDYPDGVTSWYWPPASPSSQLSEAEFASRLQEHYIAVKKIVMETPLTKLLEPAGSRRAGYQNIGMPEGDANLARRDDGDGGDCAGVHVPSVPPAQLALTRIVTLDFGSKEVSSELVLAGGRTYYASKEALYLADDLWLGWLESANSAPQVGDPINWTAVHKFDLRDSKRAPYAASGLLAGSVLNQFSLDEDEGVLRVAATEQRVESIVTPPKDAASSVEPWPQPQTRTVSHLTTLRQQGDRLEILGRTPDLAPGEQIYSARFSGKRGFVVTFRQVDPLFAIDLSDPAHPMVTGELKIPGFSEYMQFVDPDTLLTIGRDADPQSGRAGGLKISLFDVSDTRQPRERFHHIIARPGWASSEASTDHKAFTYFARSGHLAVPVSHYDWNRTSGGPIYDNALALFHIDKETGIRPAGSLNLVDLGPRVTSQNIGWMPLHLQVRRSVFADDFVYAISASGIKVATIAEPETTVGAVVLTCKDCDVVMPAWCGRGPWPTFE